MTGLWPESQRKFDSLQSRERLMIFVAGVAILAGLAFVLSIDGALAKHKIATGNTAKYRSDLVQLQKQNSELSLVLSQDPDVVGRKQIEDLKQQLSGYDNELRGVQQGLVPPKQMAKLLADMLNRDSQVRLVKLRTLPVAALVEPPTSAAGTASNPTKNLVYKHGIELTVEGGYLELMEYQSRLEKLPWRMFFARTRVNAADYPKVLMTVTLYTLSLEEAWLVV
jgi:MSHA biogenesis protein MshJ